MGQVVLRVAVPENGVARRFSDVVIVVRRGEGFRPPFWRASSAGLPNGGGCRRPR